MIPRGVVFFEGDSLTSDAQAGCQPFPSFVVQSLAMPADLTLSNIALPGSTVITPRIEVPAGTMLQRFAANVAAHRTAGPINIVCLWGGTNDLALTTDATTVYAGILDYLRLCDQAGFRLVVSTILPRAASATFAAFNARRTQVNAALRSNAHRFAGFVDLGAHDVLGDPAAPNDTHLFYDGTHPTQAAVGMIADAVTPVLRTLITEDTVV